MRRIFGGRLATFGVPLLVLLLSLPALRPLLEPGYLEGHDSIVHLLRLVEFHRLFSEGYFYPRWFPDFAQGYGYPLLHYYAPLTYYVAEAFHLLGFGFVNAIKLTVALSLLLSGLGMYLYVNQILRNRSAAFLAALAYAYLPYRLVDIYVRGAFAEVLSLTFLPFLLLFFYRLTSTGGIANVTLAALLLSGLLLNHPTAMFFVPLLLVYAAATGLLSSAPRRRLGLLAFATLLGLAGSSFYWLPAFIEQKFSSIDNMVLLGITPANNFVQLSDLVQRNLAYSYEAFPFRMGLLEAILAVAGLVFLVRTLRRSPRQNLPLALFPACGLLFLLLLSPLSALFWEKVPIVGSIQFPWRLLTFVGLCSSICIGFLGTLKRLGTLLALAASLALILASMVSLPVKPLAVTEDSLSIGLIARYENDTGIIGTTYQAEWLPSVAKAGYVSPVSGPPKAQPAETFSPLTSANLVRTGPLAYRLAVSAAQATVLRLHAFAFPGWQAEVDGHPSTVYPSTLLGLVTVDIPPGEHIVEISFGDTPVRTAGRLASLSALLTLACLSLLRSIFPADHRELAPAGSTSRSPDSVPFASWSWLRRAGRENYLGLALAPVVLALFLSPLALKGPPVANQELQAVSQRPLQADFADEIRLLGFELRAPSSEGDWPAEATLYWQAFKPLPGAISASLEWVDDSGTAFPAGTGRPVFATSSAQTWSTNEVIRDLRPLRLPDRPLSKAKLQLTVWEDSRKLGTAELGTVDAVPANLAPPNRLANAAVVADFGGKIGLVSYDLKDEGRESDGRQGLPKGLLALARPGDKLRLNLSWKALAETDQDYTVFVHLSDRKLTGTAQHDGYPQGGFRPTSLWFKDTVISDWHELTLPPTAKPGLYRLEVGLYQLRTMQRLDIVGANGSAKVLGDVKVLPGPARLDPSIRLDATLGGSFALWGYDLSTSAPAVVTKENKNVTLNLYWRAAGEVNKDYKVFVHLVDGDGRLVAQQDGEPVEDNYPTSYWSKGEEILDKHEIGLDADQLSRIKQIQVGLYDPATGQRLTTSTGADTVAIPAADLSPR